MIEQIIKISKYKPLSGSSYIDLPKKLNHARKDLTNTQNRDCKEYLKWCLARCLHPGNKNPAQMRKTDKVLRENLINVSGYENKENLPIYLSKTNYKR